MSSMTLVSRLRSCALASAASASFSSWSSPPLPPPAIPPPPPSSRPWVVEERGAQVLHEPLLNKGTAFSHSERERLGLRGLLPPRPIAFETQIQRFLTEFRREGRSAMDKWRMLQALQDRNETLFYRIIKDNITEMAPIIYTPTVGQACKSYSMVFRRPRGMFFSLEDKGEMASMVWNWPTSRVGVVVVTDGSRILGLGDLGVNGMGICVGKLDLYVAGAGIHPTSVLPCHVDVGTDNKELLDDPMYVGLRSPRVHGKEYIEIMDEFMNAIHRRWPKALIQFEDFQTKHAKHLLDRYRYEYCCFNDDIQGTAAVVLAGIYGALLSIGKEAADIIHQKFVVCGAGSAATGVIEGVVNGMVSHGMAREEAYRNFYVMDKDGLLGKGREASSQEVEPLIREDLADGVGLVDVIKEVKPTGIFGLSTIGGLFDAQVLTEMAANHERPFIFALSNPTSNAECTAEEAVRYTQGRAIFSSGSPFNDVTTADGSVVKANQGNNFYVFPGIGLGALLCGSRYISDRMLSYAAEALPKMLTEEQLARGEIYPCVDDIRLISNRVAEAVILAAVEENIASVDVVIKACLAGPEHLRRFIETKMFDPVYVPLVYMKNKPVVAQRPFKYDERAQGAAGPH